MGVQGMLFAHCVSKPVSGRTEGNNLLLKSLVKEQLSLCAACPGQSAARTLGRAESTLAVAGRSGTSNLCNFGSSSLRERIHYTYTKLSMKVNISLE